MKILFAYNLRQNDNDFVKIHAKLLSDLGHVVVSSKKEFWRPTTNYDILIISWPESLFGWRKAITNAELAKLNHSIERFRSSKTKIFTFLHDEYSHLNRSVNRNLIFDICYGKADVLIHLGAYSRDRYQKIYNRASHSIIHHPLYKDFMFDLDGGKSRDRLKITQDEFLAIVPGCIRKIKEIEYAIQVFKRIDTPRKNLDFLRTSYLEKPRKVRSFVDFRSWINCFFQKIRYQYLEGVDFHHGFMKAESVSQYFSACDAVIIPRIDILNSGNITLAAQFGKRIFGTGKGNMKELLKVLRQVVVPFNKAPEKISVNGTLCGMDHDELIVKELIQGYAGDDVIKKQWLDLISE